MKKTNRFKEINRIFMALIFITVCLAFPFIECPVPNFVRAFISIIILVLVLSIKYQYVKISKYQDILKEISENKIGDETYNYVTKAIVELQYKLRKDTVKFEKIPSLKKIYISQLTFFKRVHIKNSNLLKDDSMQFKNIIETELLNDFWIKHF